MSSALSLQPPPAGARALGGEVGRILYRLRHAFTDPYRPERHYMRGPGPKWREKHLLDRAGAN